LIVSEYCEKPSHWNEKRTLSKWLKENSIPALHGIDTRALTQKLRETGTMLGKIVKDPSSDLELHDPNKDNLVADVSIKKPKVYKGGQKRVILMDCGCKFNILRSLLKRGVTVIRVPWNYDFFEHKEKFDGIFISNGPGDPALLTETHAIIKKALKSNVPVFGICLGAQLMAIAAGAKTYKLKYGHRAQNQPCIEVGSQRCYITSQNHGFAIREKSLPKGWKAWFINANDKTVEGIKHKTKPLSAVQFHPEATPGPTDTNYLIDRFVDSL
jgi:carbamoyl-phosphate synthase small subunit